MTSKRVSEDPYYHDVFDVFGETALAGAGWFDDEAVPESLEDPHPILPLCTPTYKLRAPEDDEIPYVLLCTGAYSPPHRGHLTMLAAAKARLEKEGLWVAGGYVSPDHDDYVGGKYNGAAALPAAHRVRLCQLASAESEWVMCCPWAALYAGTAINFTDVIQRLQTYLRAHWHPATRVVYACGADNAGFARAFVHHGNCVIVPRANAHHRVSAVLSDPKLHPALDDGRLLLAAEHSAHNASSTLSREKGNGLSSVVAAELAVWNFEWGKLDVWSGPEVPVPYALRNDLEWASRHWRGCVGAEVLKNALASFREGVISALTRAFQETSWPDRPRVLVPYLLELEDQNEQARRMMREQFLLSLDVCTDANAHLHLSREFGLADGQAHSTHLEVSPGYPGLPEQMGEITRDEVALLDDDTSTGLTLNSVRLMLASHGIEVSESHSLFSRLVEEPFDIVDLRDFLFGSFDGGLVVRLLGGELTRVPYLPPWVSLAARAKTPPSTEAILGRELWRLNEQFFRETELRVSEMHNSVQPLLDLLGAESDQMMSDLCRQLTEVRIPYQRQEQVEVLTYKTLPKFDYVTPQSV